MAAFLIALPPISGRRGSPFLFRPYALPPYSNTEARCLARFFRGKLRIVHQPPPLFSSFFFPPQLLRFHFTFDDVEGMLVIRILLAFVLANSNLST